MSTPDRKFKDAYPSELLHEELQKLQGFDRIVYTLARTLQITRGATLKTGARGKTMTSVDVSMNYLKKVDATNFETGKSAVEIAKATGYKRVAMSQALNSLLQRGLIKSEQRGRQIKYYLPTS